MSDHNAFSTAADELLRTIDAALPRLRSMADSVAALPRAPGKWSPKQVIGHLIDSAANNHHRFVRAQEGPLTFPPYAQDHWVGCQHYNDRAWEELTGLWYAYNRHLAHVIGRIPERFGQVPCTVETNAPVTLGFLAHDYVVHLQHHLGQVGARS